MALELAFGHFVAGDFIRGDSYVAGLVDGLETYSMVGEVFDNFGLAIRNDVVCGAFDIERGCFDSMVLDLVLGRFVRVFGLASAAGDGFFPGWNREETFEGCGL